MNEEERMTKKAKELTDKIIEIRNEICLIDGWRNRYAACELIHRYLSIPFGKNPINEENEVVRCLTELLMSK